MLIKGIQAIVFLTASVLLAADPNSEPNTCAKPATDHNAIADSNSKPIAGGRLGEILAQLEKKSREVSTYTADISYLQKQPLTESEVLHTGKLFYWNTAKISKLRINFDTLKQEQEKPVKYLEQYIFDGVTLVRINYELKSAEYRQLAEPNKPMNAFELASEYMPIIGFTSPEKLNKDFCISLAKEQDNQAQLTLTPRPGSRFKDDYKTIEFWIDIDRFMPVRVLAINLEGDISDIHLTNAAVNKELPAGVFNVDVPADFGKNVIPLDKNRNIKTE